MNAPKKTTASTSLLTMNIIGSGKLGRTLARLFYDSGLIEIGGIYNRTISHSQAARDFIGSGTVIGLTNTNNISSLNHQPIPQADLWMIATPDDAINTCAEQLAGLDVTWKNTVVFHTSGLKTSAELALLKKLGSSTASAHPAHSFASPKRSLTSFASTVCTLEGDSIALETLSSLFSAIDAQVTHIEPGSKALYHAATVMASNYLVALVGASEILLEKAGIQNTLSGAILYPLMEQTLQNVLRAGPIKALTGPIARGDKQTIKSHLETLDQNLPELSNVYKNLGSLTLQIARQQLFLSPTELAAIEQLLQTKDTKSSI